MSVMCLLSQWLRYFRELSSLFLASIFHNHEISKEVAYSKTFVPETGFSNLLSDCTVLDAATEIRLF